MCACTYAFTAHMLRVCLVVSFLLNHHTDTHTGTQRRIDIPVEHLSGTPCTCMDLVIHHVLQTLVVCRSEENQRLQGLASVPIVQPLVAVFLVATNVCITCKSSATHTARTSQTLQGRPEVLALVPVTKMLIAVFLVATNICMTNTVIFMQDCKEAVFRCLPMCKLHKRLTPIQS